MKKKRIKKTVETINGKNKEYAFTVDKGWRPGLCDICPVAGVQIKGEAGGDLYTKNYCGLAAISYSACPLAGATEEDIKEENGTF